MRFWNVLSLLLVVIGCDAKSKTNPGEMPKDNTGVNARDADKMKKTPLDQNENQPDIDITADIRKQVVATKMSIKAQNIKIITQAGKTTLRGPVDNADEKKRVEEIAHGVAGKENIISEIEIATP